MAAPLPDDAPPRASRIYARLVVALRWPIVLAWIAAAVAASLYLPAIGGSSDASPEGLVADNSEAIAAQERSYQLFGYPLLTESAVVQRAPDGLSADAIERAARRAADSADGLPGMEGLALAAPVVNEQALLPFARENRTSIVTYLYFDPATSIGDRYRVGHDFAARYVSDPGDHLVGLTGVIPARVEQEDAIEDALPWIELATVVLIAGVIGLTMRSLLAPLMTLLAAGLAYAVAVRVITWSGEQADVAVPRELEPLVLVLLLGIVTDYAIFFMSEFRRQLCDGRDRLEAARHATAHMTPIVLVAGLIVMAGTATLAVGTLGFFRALGPGLALTAGIGVAIALTLVPALLAIAGGRAFRGAVARAQASDPPPAPTPGRLHRAARSRVLAGIVALACAAGLVYATAQLREAEFGFTLVRGLPSDAEARQAADAAAQGFVPGVISPTELLIEAPDLGGRASELAALQDLIERQPGVAGTAGPREDPVGERAGIVTSDDGSAARALVILDSDPFGSQAIDNLRELRDNLPALMREAGLDDASVMVGGQTALALETVDDSFGDFWRLLLAALLVNFLLLAVFLRALVAPLYLLAASALALGASLGLTVLISREVLGYGELTYFVPFAAAVLLLSLGSDYNVFVVGRIWREARTRSVPDAVAVAAPQASGAIAVAGLVMAASFALLALVPLVPFREFALVMSLGILIDSFAVRAILTPALVSTFGALGGWPGNRLSTPPEIEVDRPEPVASPR